MLVVDTGTDNIVSIPAREPLFIDFIEFFDAVVTEIGRAHV